jgi:hypothetical protein
LAILAVGAVMELRARRQAQQAFQTLEGLIDSAPGLEPQAVQKHLGVKPVEAYRTEDKRWVEVYRWDGLLQPYWVYATYRIGATRLLLSVTQNRPPE